MKTSVKLDFVSDLSCPFCALALTSLHRAKIELQDEIDVDVILHPYELNQDMPQDGKNFVDYLMQKSGATADQVGARLSGLRDRGSAIGFDIQMNDDSRIFNTFNAHQLLHWSAKHGKQFEVARALYEAYFSSGKDISDKRTLAGIAGAEGLDAVAALKCLEEQTFAGAVRGEEDLWKSRGVASVPAVYVDGQIAMQESKSVDSFVQTIRARV